MAKLLHVTLKDVNGINGGTHFWCNNEVESLLAMQAIANLSNAQIVSGYMSEQIDVTTITNNTASATNIETVRAKAKIRMWGNDAGSVTNPKAYVTFEVPAPDGSLVNGGVDGDITNALLVPFKTKVISISGVTMTDIDRIWYGRAR